MDEQTIELKAVVGYFECMRCGSIITERVPIVADVKVFKQLLKEPSQCSCGAKKPFKFRGFNDPRSKDA